MKTSNYTTFAEQIAARKYDDAFRTFQETNDVELVGDMILVQRFKTPELVTGGGIIVAAVDTSVQRNTIHSQIPVWCKVLAVGKGFYDPETGKDVPLDVKPGNIIMVSPISIQPMSMFCDVKGVESDDLALTRENEIKLRFKSEDAYVRVMAAMNARMKAKTPDTMTDTITDHFGV